MTPFEKKLKQLKLKHKVNQYQSKRLNINDMKNI